MISNNTSHFWNPSLIDIIPRQCRADRPEGPPGCPRRGGPGACRHPEGDMLFLNDGDEHLQLMEPEEAYHLHMCANCQAVCQS